MKYPKAKPWPSASPDRNPAHRAAERIPDSAAANAIDQWRRTRACACKPNTCGQGKCKCMKFDAYGRRIGCNSKCPCKGKCKPNPQANCTLCPPTRAARRSRLTRAGTACADEADKKLHEVLKRCGSMAVSIVNGKATEREADYTANAELLLRGMSPNLS